MQRKHVSWVVALCGWVICPQSLKKEKKNILPSSSGLCVHPRGYESIRGVITLKTKAACSFETSRSSYPTQRHKNPEDLLPQYKNRFATNKIFSTVSFPVGKQQPSCTTLVVSYAVVFSLSLVTYITKSQLLLSSLYLHLNGCCAEHSTLPSLFMSLSHTCVQQQGWQQIFC